MGIVIQKQAIHNYIDTIPEEKLGEVLKALLEHVPVTEPYPDEVEALKAAKDEFERGECVSIDDIVWD